MTVNQALKTGTRFYPPVVEPRPEYCACGARLSKYRDEGEDHCWPCQEKAGERLCA